MLYFDLESGSYKVYSDFRIAVSAKDKQVSREVHRTPTSLVDVLVDALKNNDPIVGHNIICFDLPYLIKAEYDRQGSFKLVNMLYKKHHLIYDTLIMYRKVLPTIKSHAMDALVEYLVMTQGLKIPKKVKIKDWSSSNMTNIKKRCIQDVVIQEQLFKHLNDNYLVPDGIANYLNLTHSFPSIAEALANGVPFNFKLAEKEATFFKNKRAFIRTQIRKHFGSVNPNKKHEEPFNPNSLAQVDAILRRKHGEGLQLSEKGNPSFNEDNENETINKFPEMKYIQALKAVNNQVHYLDPTHDGDKSFYNFWRDNKRLNKACVYSSLTILGARTVRSSFKEPPVNQLDKRVRQVVDAPEGWTMVGVDIISLEFALQSYFLKELFDDNSLEKQFEQRLCPKQYTIDLFGELFDRVVLKLGETLKDRAKKINYAVSFGQGIAGTCKTLNLPSTQAFKDKVKAARLRRFPSINRLKDYLSSIRDKQDCIANMFNTRVQSPEYCIVNTLMQSSGAEYSLMILGLYFNEVKKIYKENALPILYNHDEVQFLIKGELEDVDVPDSPMYKIRDNIEVLWKKAYPSCPFITGLDVQMGRSWKDTH